ncbi:hypothetical protein CFP56_024015, partial [Quercus suber]
SSSQLWGCFFVTIGSVFFVGFLFAAVISKLLPPSHNALISSIQKDWYYCFLVPLTLPVLVVAYIAAEAALAVEGRGDLQSFTSLAAPTSEICCNSINNVANLQTFVRQKITFKWII